MLFMALPEILQLYHKLRQSSYFSVNYMLDTNPFSWNKGLNFFFLSVEMFEMDVMPIKYIGVLNQLYVGHVTINEF